MKKLLLSLIGTCILSFGYGQDSNIEIFKGQEAHDILNNTNLIRTKSYTKVPNYIQFIKGKEPSDNEVFGVLSRFSKKPLNFNVISVEKDELGMEHQRYRQTIEGFPVEHSMLITHKKNNKIVSVNGDVLTSPVNTKTPSIQFSTALYIAKGNINAQIYKWEDPNEELFIKMEMGNPTATFMPQKQLVYITKDGDLSKDLRLAYKLDVYASKPLSRHEIYIDAVNGEVLYKNNLIHTADVVGSAVTGYSGTQVITADSSSGSFRLRETGRGNGIETYDLNKSTSHASAVDFVDNDNIWNNANPQLDEYAGDAHWGAEMTYDYFWQIHNRNSIDGSGFKLRSYIHYDSNYTNAFWDGQRMTYGDGGASFTPLTSMIIAGHEITHGLISRTADLVYSYESGALNESFADIFGVSIDFWSRPTQANWILGDEISGGTYVMRNMSNPNAKNHPDTYLGQYWHTSSSDNGGVHTNSGVQNYWYYLMINGGSGTNDNSNSYNVTGLGQSKAEKITFRNLVTYLSSNSQYADARFYAIQSAVDLYGPCSSEVETTTDAWYAVGVGNSFTLGVTADFSSPNVTGCAPPLSVSFINLSTNATTFSWDFGDGGTSNTANPTHSYTSSGLYTVTLIADGGACGIDTITKTAFVNIDPSNPCPVTLPPGGAAPTITSCTGILYDNGGAGGSYAPNQDTYVTISPTGATSVTLDMTFLDIEFGSGDPYQPCDYDYLEVYDGTSTSAPLIGRYCNSNLPPATITSTGGAVTIYFHTDLYVNEQGFKIEWQCSTTSPVPIANFSSNTTLVCAGDQVQFFDLSSGAPTSWSWTFLGGTPGTSTQQNPSVTYSSPGTYDVTLQVSNASGSNTRTKIGYITVFDVPSANFSSTTIGLSVNFSDLSIGATQWDWNFGDGNVSTSQNNTHTYASAGSYTVCLTIDNPSCDTVSTCQTINVISTASIEEAKFIDLVKIFPNPSTDIVNVHINFSKNQKLDLRLIDVVGKVHYEYKSANESTGYKERIDLTNLSRGTYILYVNSIPYKITRE